jgi:hypothetical protein
MENDSIRASGSDTLIDIWIEGKLRAICIKRAAIDTYLGASGASDMSDEGRCEFVRTHLPELVSAAKAQLKANDPASDTVVIDAGELGGPGERRKAERRKTTLPAQDLPHGERRRSQRRRADRRQTPRSGS